MDQDMLYDAEDESIIFILILWWFVGQGNVHVRTFNYL